MDYGYLRLDYGFLIMDYRFLRVRNLYLQIPNQRLQYEKLPYLCSQNDVDPSKVCFSKNDFDPLFMFT